MKKIDCDVAVIGAGPAGLAAAISLSKQGTDTVVLERGNFDELRIGEHVPPEARPLLHNLGYPLSNLSGHHLDSDGVVGLWAEAEHVGRDYLYSGHGLGINLTRPLFDRELAHLAKAAGTRILTGVRLSLSAGPPDWQIDIVKFKRTHSIRCRYIVDASGRMAWLTRKLRIGRRMQGRQLASLAYLGTDGMGRDTRLKIEMSGSSWWYALPLIDNRHVIAELGPQSERSQRVRSNGYGWLARFRETELISQQVNIQKPPKLITCAAYATGPTKVCGERWIAIGDAACTFDPLAGQGIRKALQDGLQIPERISRGPAITTREPLGYQKEISDRLNAHFKQLNNLKDRTSL